MKWSTERQALLRKFWGQGLSGKDVAKEMGGFEHCDDGGRSSVLGQVRKNRIAAEQENNDAAVKFWSRGKKTVGLSTRAHARKTSKPPRIGDKSLGQEAVNSFVASVVVKQVERPTDAEVRAEWVKQLSASAKG